MTSATIKASVCFVFDGKGWRQRNVERYQFTFGVHCMLLLGNERYGKAWAQLKMIVRGKVQYAWRPRAFTHRRFAAMLGWRVLLSAIISRRWRKWFNPFVRLIDHCY